MIHFNPDTRTFNLQLQISCSAGQIDQADRVVHLLDFRWQPAEMTPIGRSTD